MRQKVNLLHFVIALCLPVFATADVVKYTDDSSNTHYVDSVEKVPEKFRAKVEKLSTQKVSRVTAATYAPLPKTVTANSKNSKSSNAEVEILVATWCSYCTALEKFLIENKVTYFKLDIEKDPEGQAKYNEHGRGGIPITRIGTKVIRGYDPNAILSTIKNQRS